MEIAKKRNSNFELMRITSMILIIITHILGHGGLLESSTGPLKVVFVLLKCITLVHVNSFVLLMGYFQYDKEFKLSKLFKINNTAWFYKAVMTVIFSALGIISLSSGKVIANLLPIVIDSYWFIRIYIYMYCLSPFVNILISKLNKNKHKILLLISFLLFSIVPTLTRQLAFNNSSGYSLTAFIFLYLLGSYLAKYPIDKEPIFKKYSINKKKIIFLSVFLGMAILNSIFYWFGFRLSELGGIFASIGRVISKSILAYDNPLVIFGTVAYFLWFSYIKIDSKFINKVASLTFGVYIIHEFPPIRGWLYTILGCLPKTAISSFDWLLRLIICTAIIFIVCSFIEWLRQLLFKWVYDWKISERLRNKFYAYFNSFKLFNVK